MADAEQSKTINLRVPERILSLKTGALWQRGAAGAIPIALVLVWSVPFLSVLYLAWTGYPSNWDFRHYHQYLAYSLFDDRLALDIAPAGLHSYFNPILHAPLYLALQVVTPFEAFAALAFIQGLNAVLLFRVSTLVFAADSATPQAIAAGRPLLSAVFALVGTSSATFLELVGSSSHDTTVSLFFLMSLIVILRALPEIRAGLSSRALWALLLAGTCLGAGVGLKLTLFPMALGLAAGLLMLTRRPAANAARVAVFGLGGALGFGIVAGPWMWVMWQEFGNPVFPFFNQVFQSPLADPIGYGDGRFRLTGIRDYLIYPLSFFLDIGRETALPFHFPRVPGGLDLRFPLFFAVMLILAAALAWPRRAARRETARQEARHGTRRAAENLILITAVASMLVWQAVFMIYRYFIGIEMLIPLIVYCALIRIRELGRAAPVAAIAALLAVTATTRTGDPGHFAWSDELMTVTAPRLADPDNTMVVITADAVSFVIPAFPPQIPFVRVAIGDQRRNLSITSLDAGTGMAERAREAVETHIGPLFVLTRDDDYEHWTTRETLARLGLKLGPQACRPVETPIDPRVRLCRLSRREG